MNGNPVSDAIDLVDTTPANDFLSALHAQLVAGFTESAAARTDAPRRLPASSDDSAEKYITLAPSSSRLGRSRPVANTLLVAAACLVVFAAGVVVATRARHDPSATTKLRDSDQELAQHGLLTADALGVEWTSGYSWGESELPIQAAATTAAMPACALLNDVGLLPPTAKSTTAHQFIPDSNLLFQQVFVFATRADAARAMNVIGGGVFPACWFNLFDRLTPFTMSGWTSTSDAWEPSQLELPNDVKITAHGNKQVIIGQHTRFARPNLAPLQRYFFNAFVQVDRTILWVNPRLLLPRDTDTVDPQQRAVAVDETITAATNALKAAIRP